MRNFQDKSQSNKVLSLIAAVGAIASGFYEILSVSEIKNNQFYSFYALIFVIFGVCVSLFILRKTTVEVFKNPDLLVPIGLYITINELIGIGSQSSSFISFKDGHFQLINLSFILAFFLSLRLIVVIVFTGWMTRTILQFVEAGKVDLISSFQNFRKWFPRTLAFIVFGWIPFSFIFLLIYLNIFGIGHSEFQYAVFYIWIFAIGAAALLWNLATAALLPYMLSAKSSLKQLFLEGIKISWANKAKTIVPVLLLMIVSGWIVVVYVHYSETEFGNAEFGEVSDSYSIKNTSNLNYSSNFVWTGNYPESSKWHSELLKVVKSEPLDSVSWRITFLMLFLSLVVNLKIVQEIWAFRNYDDEISKSVFDVGRLNHGGKLAAFAGLILIFLPLELITQSLKYNSASSNSAKIPEIPQVIKGENFFNKQKLFEVGQGNTVSVLQKEDKDKFEVRGINDVAVGDLDGEKGQDIVVATGIGTLILNPNGEIKKEISYEIKGSDGDSSNNYFGNQKIVDINEDGLCEIVNTDNFHAPNGIYNLQGKSVFDLDKKQSNETGEVLAAGDLNGDQIAELYSISDSGIKPFKPNASDSKTVFNDSLLVFDDEGRGSLKLLTSQPQAVIKNDKGKILKKITKPFLQNGYLVEKNKEPLSIYFGDNFFGLFDSDGKLKSKYDAPLSEEKYGYFDKREARYGGDLKVNIYKAEALHIKLLKDKPEYLAVMAHQSSELSRFAVMFYIYDSEGTLVYQELFDDITNKMTFMPSENDETSGLLISTNNKILKYTAQ